jgi:hypothetical protein
MTAFFCYSQKRREEMKKEGVKMAVTEQTKKFSEEWKKMDVSEKKPFEEKAVEDKKRYEKEMAGYTPPEKESDSSSSDDGPKKKKAKKDPNAPKRAMNAYMYFMQDQRAAVKEKNPKLTNKELLSELGAEWKKLSDKDKEPYNQKAADDKTRYQNEMKKYKK